MPTELSFMRGGEVLVFFGKPATQLNHGREASPVNMQRIIHYEIATRVLALLKT